MFVLLIGDHGGGTFKLLLEDLSRAKPNSPTSSILIGQMEGKDCYENLKAAFGYLKV